MNEWTNRRVIFSIFLFFAEASGLIRDILTVSPAKRANIVDICSHWWVNQDCENRLTDIAEDLANLTPVRLDFLFALDQPETTAQNVSCYI